MFINTIVHGILLGGLYAIVALGLSLVFGVMRLVNLAHGTLIVGGGYLAHVVVGWLGLDPLVCELSPGRLARAAAHGFETHAPKPEKKEFAKAVRGLTGGGAGIVVDCTGAVPALEAALEMSERGGRIVIAGIPKKPVAVDAGRMVLYEL